MGSFFTNIQIYTGKEPKQDIQNVIRALDGWAMDKDYIAAKKGKTPDRTIALAAANDGRWITVYDEGSEDQEDEVMNELLATLSSRLQAIVVGITVHDSDLLWMRMYENGEPVDSYSNEYMYWDNEPSPEQKLEMDGHPERWQRLLGKKDPKELRQAWDTQEAFVEDKLHLAAQALDMDMKHCMTGYNYNHLARDLTRLRYVYGGKREPAYEIIKEGPPDLEVLYGPGEISSGFTNGTHVEMDYNYIFDCQSIGGPTTGLAVVIWGKAIDEGILQVAKVIGMVKKGQFQQEPMEATIQKKLDETNKQSCFEAIIKDYPIPEGVVWKLTDKLNKMEKEKRSEGSNIFMLYIQFKPEKAENSDFRISFIPFGQSGDKQKAYIIETKKDILTPNEKLKQQMERMEREQKAIEEENTNL